MTSRRDGERLGISRPRGYACGARRGERAALDFLDVEDWPMTTATRDVTAQWITTDQFTWAVNALLDGVTASS